MPLRRVRLIALSTVVLTVWPFAPIAPALAAPGDGMWSATYDGPSAGVDGGADVAADPALPQVYVVGSSVGNGTKADFVTAAYSTVDGSRLWVARYDGRAHGEDAADEVVVGAGRVVVAGTSRAPDHHNDFALVAYDAVNGHRRWVARYGSPSGGDDYLQSVAMNAAGTRVYATGFHEGGDGLTVAFAATTGKLLWVARYKRGSSDLTTVVTRGRRVYVGGSWAGAATATVLAIAYSTRTGVQKWVSRASGPGDEYDRGASATLAADGAAFVIVGATDSGPVEKGDFFTAAFATGDGHKLWSDVYGGSGQDYDEAFAVAAGSSGEVFVTGPATGDQRRSYTTLAYDALSGDSLWAPAFWDVAPQNYGGEPADIVVSPDGGSLFVTGMVNVINLGGFYELGYGTVAYSTATGEPELWSSRDGDDPSNYQEEGVAVTVVPDGSQVIVTGQYDRDIVTRAFDTN